MSIIGRFKEWFMSLLPTKDIFKQMGVTPQYSASMPTLIESWRNTYQGNPSWIGTDDKSLGFPTVVCWDIAKKAIGELKIGASLPTPEGQKNIAHEATEELIRNRIKPFLRSQVEYALAMGGVVARPWYDQDAKKVRIGWYTADMALPTAWDGKRLTGVVLIDRIVRAKDNVKTIFTKLESIQPNQSGWTISTKLYKSTTEGQLGSEVPLATIPQWADITPEVPIIGDVCPFTYMGTPWANNQDFNSAQGTSLFRDAMDNLPELDRTYTTLCWEVESGKAAVFVDDSMIEVDPTNPKRDLLDPLEKRLYRKLSSVEGKDMLEPYNPNLRIDQLNAALKTQLSVVCMACHLDSGAYVYDQAAQAVTATEVRTKQQQTYGTIVDIQDQMIRPFIVEMIDNIRALQTLYGIEAIPEDILLGFDFGDSILVDEQSDRANAQAEVSVGLRSKLAYLMDYRGMTETEALAEIERIKAETPVVTGFFGA
jgi:A118 family predicted phage portal protein